MRLLVSSVLAALVLTLAGVVGTEPATAAPVVDSRTDLQCTGQDYVDEPSDEQRADDLMAGQVTMSNFGPWQMPDDLTWTEDPFSDNNWVFQLNSLHWADPLRRVGLATDNQAMLDRYEAIIHDWVQDNPVSAPRTRFAWYDMADGFRAIALVCLAAMLPDEPRWLTDAIDTHAAMLSDPSRYASTNNHGLYQNLGLLALGCSFDVPRWRELAVQRATTLLALAVDDQGVTNEGSVEYQGSNYSWYRQLARRLDLCGLPRIPNLDRIELMPTFLAHATQPDGTLLAWGDTSAGVPVTHPLAGIHGGPHPDGTFAVFRRGYVFSRSGWFDTQPGDEQSLASIRFGEPKALAVHGHQDSGAVSFFALGSQILWQPGLWGGAGGPERRYVLSNEAHNVIDVAGATYDSSAPTPLVAADSNDQRDLVTVWSNALQGVAWQRTMVHAKAAGLLVVDDQVFQRDRRRVRQLWQLGADRQVRTTGCDRADTTGTGTNVTLLWAAACPRLSVTEGQSAPMLGWRSPRVNEFVPAPTLAASQVASQVRMTTVIVPRAEGTRAAEVQLLDITTTAGGQRVLKVRVGPKVYRISLSSTAATVTTVRSPSRTLARLDGSTRAPRLRVRVRATTAVVPTGRVSVEVGGQAASARLRAGTADVRLPRLAPGRYRIRATYLGSSGIAPSAATVRGHVVPTRTR